MPYLRAKPTNWDKYHKNRPTNPFLRWFFLDVMVAAYKELLSKVNLPTSSSILELGAGTGYVTKELSTYLNASNVTLVDFNQGMLDISRETFKNTLVPAEFIKSDFFALDIQQKYDLVHSGGVIEHFAPEKQQALVDLHAKLLKPSGYCIIYVPTPTPSYRLLRKIAEILGIWIYTDEIPITKDELVSIVQKSGLKVISTNYFWKNYYLSEVGIIAQKPAK